MGSEMCIRDSYIPGGLQFAGATILEHDHDVSTGSDSPGGSSSYPAKVTISRSTGSESGGSATVGVSGRDLTGPVTVNVASSTFIGPGKASHSDFVPFSRNVVLTPDDPFQSFSVSIIDDAIEEPTETLDVVGTVVSGSATVRSG